MSRPSLLRRVVLLVCVAAIAACGQAAPTTPYTRVSEATLAAAAIPAPTDHAVLTITGDISVTNDGDDLSLDLATIERMGLVRYTVHDPWLDLDLEFTGVLVSEFLDTIGASAEAETLTITALDDYIVELSIADIRRWPILLATQTGGEPMAIEDKGPTRIVFPAHPEIDELKYKDLWIWQLKTIEVR